MAKYATTTEVKRHHHLIDRIPGGDISAKTGDVSNLIDSKIGVHFEVPLETPYPETVSIACAKISAGELLQANVRGRSAEEAREFARSLVKSGWDTIEGIIDRPEQLGISMKTATAAGEARNVFESAHPVPDGIGFDVTKTPEAHKPPWERMR